jgi:hypothetical protein
MHGVGKGYPSHRQRGGGGQRPSLLAPGHDLPRASWRGVVGDSQTHPAVQNRLHALGSHRIAQHGHLNPLRRRQSLSACVSTWLGNEVEPSATLPRSTTTVHHDRHKGPRQPLPRRSRARRRTEGPQSSRLPPWPVPRLQPPRARPRLSTSARGPHPSSFSGIIHPGWLHGPPAFGRRSRASESAPGVPLNCEKVGSADQ